MTPDIPAHTLAPIPPAAVAGVTRITRRLAEHSLSPNTRDAYARALRQFDAWRGPEAATDATLAAYLGWLFERGRAPATAALVVAAVTFRATLAGTAIRGPQTGRVLAGFRARRRRPGPGPSRAADRRWPRRHPRHR